jgi:hypothetical protein
MISILVSILENYLFEIIVIVSIIFIIGLGIYYKIKGNKGTYNNKEKYDYFFKRKELLKPIKIKRGKTESKGEKECRRVLEKIFNKPFLSVRPDFLKNPVTGNEHNLEIDCYNEDLKLGVEYNGVQHYKYVSFFHKNKEHFLNQKYRDEMKKNMCKDNDITLIEVPYYIAIDEIEKFLIDECKKHNYIFNDE